MKVNLVSKVGVGGWWSIAVGTDSSRLLAALQWLNGFTEQQLQQVPDNQCRASLWPKWTKFNDQPTHQPQPNNELTKQPTEPTHGNWNLSQMVLQGSN